MAVVMFPGQGSQMKGMGKDLFDRYPQLTAQADSVLNYSIQRLCLDDPQQQLNQTQYTQPALFVVNALSWTAYLDEKGKNPDYVLGHSLGEYNALYAAGVFDFQTGVKLVRKRGELMSLAAGGAMAAVIGLTQEKVREVLAQHKLTEVVVANDNTVTQQVISGPKALVSQASEVFQKEGAKMVIPLKVSGAFHSPLMKNARESFMEFLKGFQFSAPKITVISNLTAQPYSTDSVIGSLADQITNPVRWTESIQYLMARGESDFLEVGPGQVLTGMIQRIRSGR